MNEDGRSDDHAESDIRNNSDDDTSSSNDSTSESSDSSDSDSEENSADGEEMQEYLDYLLLLLKIVRLTNLTKMETAVCSSDNTVCTTTMINHSIYISCREINIVLAKFCEGFAKLKFSVSRSIY